MQSTNSNTSSNMLAWTVPAAVSVIVVGLTIDNPVFIEDLQQDNTQSYNVTSAPHDRFLNDTLDSQTIVKENEYNLGRGITALTNTVWSEVLVERVSYLSKKVDGWKGEGSLSASPTAKDDALNFINKLENEGITAYPKIGLDGDGAFTFFWNENDLLIDLSIYGDRTYSFFAKHGDSVASEDEAKISDPLLQSLVRIINL